MATAPLLTATSSGDALELRPAGSWTASKMLATLERLSNDIAPQLDRAAAIKLDMAGVRELDTLGAWLLEKLSRRATSAGHRADIIGIADNYTGLIDKVVRSTGERQRQLRHAIPSWRSSTTSAVPPSVQGKTLSHSCRCWAPYALRSWASCGGHDRCG